MTILMWICAGSAFLLFVFWVFKGWEIRRSNPTFVTLFFQRHSPTSEKMFNVCVAYVRSFIVRCIRAIRRVFKSLTNKIIALVRTAFVVFGAHLIRIARGEHLLSESRIPSIYFKLLHRHKKNINGSEIPKGIAQPDIPRRIRIQVSNEDRGGATSLEQVE